MMQGKRVELFSFLRASARLDVRPSVRPSVCLSVTRWHPIKTAEHIVMLSSPHDSPFILVLCYQKYSRNSDGVTPCGGAKQRWGMIKPAIFQKHGASIVLRFSLIMLCFNLILQFYPVLSNCCDFNGVSELF